MYCRFSIPSYRICGSAKVTARMVRALRGGLSSLVLAILFATHASAAAEPAPSAVAAFDAYVESVESRLVLQHRAQMGFLTPISPQDQARLRQGELIIERVTPAPAPNLPGAMLHHWRGTAFAPGASAADFERLMTNFAAYPQVYSPQVLEAKVLSQQGERYSAIMRVRQKHVITVVLDTTYDIRFGMLDARHGYSFSRSMRIDEIDSPGTRNEHALAPGEEHGFLWRLNTYWSFEERDGGLYIQIESISLTRSIPSGLGWIVGPFIESIPRESLEFTLRQTCNALRK